MPQKQKTQQSIIKMRPWRFFFNTTACYRLTICNHILKELLTSQIDLKYNNI